MLQLQRQTDSDACCEVDVTGRRRQVGPMVTPNGTGFPILGDSSCDYLQLQVRSSLSIEDCRSSRSQGALSCMQPASPLTCHAAIKTVCVFKTVYSDTGLPVETKQLVGILCSATYLGSTGLQVHYDNSAGTPGRIDSSGVRIYYTDPRPVEVYVSWPLVVHERKVLWP